mgnify:CR=1 FL=1
MRGFLVQCSLYAVVCVLAASCARQPTNETQRELTIFAAGSMAAPLTQLADAFEAAHPNIKINIESSGTMAAIRKITDLGRPADLLFSADASLIEEHMFGQHAAWYLVFGSNELALLYKEGSKFAGEVTPENWPDLLLRADIHFGRCDPVTAPCGYRAVQLFKLAENFYHREGIADALIGKDANFIRSQEPDLLALIETGAIDAAFMYASAIAQHDGLAMLRLPDEINFGNPAFAENYATVDAEIAGEKPGETVRVPGRPSIYAVTIPIVAANSADAVTFLHMLIADTGTTILKKNGMRIVPAAITGNAPANVQELAPENTGTSP